MREPGGQRRARRRRQRHHPLAPALAAHQDHPRIAPRRRHRQRDQFADPEPGGVEDLHQADVAQPLRLGPPEGRGGVEQPVDLGLAQAAGQGALPLRPLDQRRRVVLAPALEKGEAVELADRRQPPRPGGLRHAAVGLVDEVGLDVGPPGVVVAAAARREEGREVAEVAGVGEQRVARGVALGLDRLEEPLEPGAGHRVSLRPPAASARRSSRAAGACPASRSVSSAARSACGSTSPPACSRSSAPRIACALAALAQHRGQPRLAVVGGALRREAGERRGGEAVLDLGRARRRRRRPRAAPRSAHPPARRRGARRRRRRRAAAARPGTRRASAGSAAASTLASAPGIFLRQCHAQPARAQRRVGGEQRCRDRPGRVLRPGPRRAPAPPPRGPRPRPRPPARRSGRRRRAPVRRPRRSAPAARPRRCGCASARARRGRCAGTPAAACPCGRGRPTASRIRKSSGRQRLGHRRSGSLLEELGIEEARQQRLLVGLDRADLLAERQRDLGGVPVAAARQAEDPRRQRRRQRRVLPQRGARRLRRGRAATRCRTSAGRARACRARRGRSARRPPRARRCRAAGRSARPAPRAAGRSERRIGLGEQEPAEERPRRRHALVGLPRRSARAPCAASSGPQSARAKPVASGGSSPTASRLTVAERRHGDRVVAARARRVRRARGSAAAGCHRSRCSATATGWRCAARRRGPRRRGQGGGQRGGREAGEARRPAGHFASTGTSTSRCGAGRSEKIAKPSRPTTATRTR